jgi:hypothetical protein
MNHIDIVVGALGAITSFGAAAFWLCASLIKVPDNLDTFIGGLQRMGRLNTYGAGCACVAALSATYAFVRSIEHL